MIGYYFSETFNIFKRAKFSALIIILTTCTAILLSASSIMLILISNNLSQEVKSDMEMNLFLQDSLATSKIDSITTILPKDDYISEIKYVSKDEAESNFIKETGEDFKSVLEVNPLPASLVLKFKPQYVNENNFETLKERYRNVSGIKEVSFDYEVPLEILHIIKSIRNFIYAGAFLMICLSIYLVYSNNKLQLNARKELFDTMKLVGARIFTIKFPLILYGIIVGLISSLICCVVYMLAINFAEKIIHGIKITEWLLMFNFVIVILGVCLGLLGSLFATRHINLKV